MRHPLQSVAENDAELLRGATLHDAAWALADFALGFSNGTWVHVFVSDAAVRWRLHDAQPLLRHEPQFRVGAPPIDLDWKGTIGVHTMDVSELVAKRIDAEFAGLCANHTGFFVYFRGHLVLQFHAAYRTDNGRDLLYVDEGE